MGVCVSQVPEYTTRRDRQLDDAAHSHAADNDTGDVEDEVTVVVHTAEGAEDSLLDETIASEDARDQRFTFHLQTFSDEHNTNNGGGDASEDCNSVALPSLSAFVVHRSDDTPRRQLVADSPPLLSNHVDFAHARCHRNAKSPYPCATHNQGQGCMSPFGEDPLAATGFIRSGGGGSLFSNHLGIVEHGNIGNGSLWSCESNCGCAGQRGSPEQLALALFRGSGAGTSPYVT